VSRDYEPVPGKWYEDLDAEETFQVLSVDPDEEIVTIQWPELTDPPDGWVDDEDSDEEDEEEEELEDEEEDDWDEDEDDDWDDDEDEDYDDEDDDYRDRE